MKCVIVIMSISGCHLIRKNPLLRHVDLLNFMKKQALAKKECLSNLVQLGKALKQPGLLLLNIKLDAHTGS